METINNMALAASRAVWGPGETATKEEPISGVQGDTAKGEPYDAGNMDDTTITKESESKSGPPLHESNTTLPSRKNNDIDVGASKHSVNTHGVDTTSKSNDVDLPIRDGTSGDLQESSATKPSKKNNDKDLLKAPGPRPVAAVAKEHGGDAGALDSTDGTRAKSSESVDSTGMPKHTPGTDDDGVQKESHGEGTGDLYVKSSGLKADGGDFDAAAPGAGREADRLLEQKGVKREPHPAKAEPTAPEKHHHSKVEDKAHIKSHSDSSVHSDKVSDKSADHAVTSDTTSGDKPKEKISLGQKIKAKLHHS